MKKQKSRGRTAGPCRFAKAGIPSRGGDESVPFLMDAIEGAFRESQGDSRVRGSGVDSSDPDSSDPRSFGYDSPDIGHYRR